MLALKKKREAEAKAKAEAEAAAAVQEPSSAPMEVDASTSSSSSSTNNSSKKVSLLGIGGKKKKSDDGGAKNGTKKRTPGEIRIQKGEFVFVIILLCCTTLCLGVVFSINYYRVIGGRLCR